MKNATSGGTEEKMKISGLVEVYKYFTDDKIGKEFSIKYFRPIELYGNGYSLYGTGYLNHIHTTSSLVNLNTCSINPILNSSTNNLYVTEAVTRTEHKISGLFLNKKAFGTFENSNGKTKKTITQIELEFLIENGNKEIALIDLKESEIEIKNTND